MRPGCSLKIESKHEVSTIVSHRSHALPLLTSIREGPRRSCSAITCPCRSHRITLSFISIFFYYFHFAYACIFMTVCPSTIYSILLVRRNFFIYIFFIYIKFHFFSFWFNSGLLGFNRSMFRSGTTDPIKGLTLSLRSDYMVPF